MANNKKITLTFDIEGNIGPIRNTVANFKKSLEDAGVEIPVNISTNISSILADLEKELQDFQNLFNDNIIDVNNIKQAEKEYGKIESLIRQLRGQSEKIQGLDPEKLIPKKNLDRIKTLKNSWNQLNTIIEKGGKASVEIDKQTRALKEQKEEVERLKVEYQKLEAENKTAESSKREKEEKIQELNKNKDDITAQKKVLESVKGGKTSAQYDDLGKQAGILSQRIKSLTAEQSNLDKTIDKNNVSMSGLSIEIAKAEDKYGEMEQALKALKAAAENPQELIQLRQELAKLANVDIDKIPKDVKELDKYIEGLSTNEINQVTTAMDKLKSSTKEMTNSVNQGAQALDNLGAQGDKLNNIHQEIEAINSDIAQFFSLSNGIEIFKDVVRDSFNTVKELDAVMTEMAVVTDYSVEDMWDRLPEYSKKASELGVATKEFYEAITLYFQQGLNEEQSIALAIETLKMGRIAGMEGAEATEAMTAALRGFNMELDQASAQKVSDVYSKLAAITATDTNQLATAMSKTASIAKSANMDLEQTAAFLAQIIETTQEAPETAGTALKTIISRFAEVKKLQNSGEMIGLDEEGEEINVNKIQEALRLVGISMDKFFAGEESLGDVFIQLSEKWKNLDFETQRYIATVAAGSRMQSRFLALMSNHERLITLVGDAYDSAGSSQAQYEKTLEGIDAKLNKLRNAWDLFTMGLANNEAIKGAIELLTNLLNVINNLTAAASNGSGLVKMILDAGVLISALRFGRNLLGGATNLVAPLLGIGTPANANSGKTGLAYMLTSSLPSKKNMSWMLGAILGSKVSEGIQELFSKDEKDESEKEQSEEKTTIINETDNSDNSNNSVDNSDNSTNTSEVVNNYLKSDSEKEKTKKEEKKTEGQQLLEAFRSGQITAENMDSETTSKIIEALHAENETLKQIEENTSYEGAESEVPISEGEATGTPTETETKNEDEEQKFDWTQILSSVAGLATAVGSQLLLEAGGEVLGNLISKKIGGKVAGEIVGDVAEAAGKKKNAQIDMSAFGPISDLDVLSQVAQATATTNKKSKLKDLLNWKGGIKKLFTENEEIKKVNQKLDDTIDSLASFAEKQYSKVPSKSVTIIRDSRSSEYQDALFKWADLNNKTIEELTSEELDLFKNASYFGTQTFDIPRLDRSGFENPMEYVVEVAKEYLPYITKKFGPVIKEKLATGLATAAPYLGAAASAATFIAPAAIATGLTQEAYQASSAEGRFENYEKIQIGRQENLSAEQNYLNELNSTKTTYDLLATLAKDFGQETDEAKWAMSEIERHADNLLKKYPELAKKAEKIAPENSSDIFKEENWNQITKEAEKEVEQAQLSFDIGEKKIENLTKEIIIKNLMIESEDALTRGRYNKAEFASSGALKAYDSMSEDNYDYLDEYFKDITGGTQEQFTYMLEAIAQTGLTFTEDYVQNIDLLFSNEKQVREAFIQILKDNGIELSDWQAEGEDLFGSLYYNLDITNSVLMNETLTGLRNLANASNTAAAATEAKAAADNAAAQQTNPQHLIDAAVARARESQVSDPVSHSIQEAEAAAARTASIPTSSSAAETVWENNFDRIYNLIESIEEETRARQRIENQYEFMLRTQNATANKILELNVQELLSLERSRQQQKELIEQRTADITMLQLKNQNLAGYASVEKNAYGDSVLRINWDAIEQITDNSLGQAVNDYISQLEEWLDTIYDAEDSLIDIENSVLDIKERGKQEYLDFENRIKDALETYYQEEIDKLSEINDTIDDTNSKIIDSIQKYVNDQRKQRDNERTEKEIEKKQRRLSYLRQDTSNANQVEILTLQEEITLEQEDYTDTLIDQRISELQEQNELAQEQRQHQIEIAQAQLEHYVSTGQIWNEVKQLMDDGLDPDKGVLRTSKLWEILSSSEGFSGLSQIGKMEWLNELNSQAINAQGWVATQSAQLLGNEILKSISNEIANLDVGSTVNNYYTVGSGSSGGYGNSGYSDSGGYTNSDYTSTPNPVVNTGGTNQSQYRSYKTVIPRTGFYSGGTFVGNSVNASIEKAKEDILKQYLDYLGTLTSPSDKNDAMIIYRALLGRVDREEFTTQFKTGGLANFTGPAWLDGTKAKPEYVLNSVQTKGFLTLVDVLDSIKNHAFTPKSENAVGNTYDIDINIETVKEEADINKIAEKVQKSIVATSQYRSNTIIKR